ncbi:hypothetical protein GCM10011515_19340 [Tsuneonella deserti]|uniref:Lipoprotein n=1 Tax=Tsuneonella deserti TaxID=2035528 RepID=A0ABQ1S8S0_9SPHN|nr:hypothetical protein [Tsuneonella deserti]GGD99643.1 hypothetical protein GCM10011515_19340 [Tsuneonella deserti]
MTKFAFTAVAAALALAACDNNGADDTAAADATATETATTAAGDTTIVTPAPTATETTVVTNPGATATTTTNANGDKVTVGPNGVAADVGDSETRVRVDTNNPTLTVEKK